MNERRADFHVHLGDRTDENLLAEAEQNGVEVLTVLDRRIIRTRRLSSLQEKAQTRGITLLPGVEVLVEYNRGNNTEMLEIVGVNPNLRHPELINVFDPSGDFFRSTHIPKIVHQTNFLRQQGFEIDELHPQWSDIYAGSIPDASARLCSIAANNPVNARLMQDMQPEIEELLKKRPEDTLKAPAKILFTKYFGVNKPAYVPWGLTAERVIDILHQAGGLAILAHPRFQHSQGESHLVAMLDELFVSGIDGVEGWDGTHDPEVDEIASKRGKLVLGGSGQDTTNYDNRIMGLGEKNPKNKPTMYIPTSKLQEIKLHQQKYR